MDLNNSNNESDSLSKIQLCKAKEELLFIVNLLFKTGLLTTTGGNISSRVGKKIVITPSGASNALLWQVTPKDLVVLDLEGRVLDGGTPSMEAPVHVALYSNISEVNAVIHAHTPLLSVFAKLGIGITENMFIREGTLHQFRCQPVILLSRKFLILNC